LIVEEISATAPARAARGCWDVSGGLETVGTGDGIPADPGVAVFEALGGTRPTEYGDQFFASVFQVMLVNALPEDMSGGSAGLEVVLGVQNRPQLADFQWFGRGANVEG